MERRLGQSERRSDVSSRSPLSQAGRAKPIPQETEEQLSVIRASEFPFTPWPREVLRLTSSRSWWHNRTLHTAESTRHCGLALRSYRPHWEHILHARLHWA